MSHLIERAVERAEDWFKVSGQKRTCWFFGFYKFVFFLTLHSETTKSPTFVSLLTNSLDFTVVQWDTSLEPFNHFQ